MDSLYTDLHVGISTRVPELRIRLREALDKGIEDLKKTGRLGQIKAKYGVE
jgi:ABC-type amino acid transport substrate-binding protein